MSAAEITALVIALGSAPLLMEAIKGFKAWKSGRAREERANNRNALGRLVKAEERADNEASYRRKMQEYASSLRRILVELGYPEDKLPPWPVRERQSTQ